MAALPPVPADLKAIAPYLTRAAELGTAEPVIAYWATFYAVQQAMSIGSKEPDSNVFLFALMDKLEAMKAALGANEAATDDAAASAFIDNFAMKIFGVADKEDRAGKATRTTAKKFLAAANFLELLSIFGEVPSDSRDKIKYSKWKATDIAKAFREGRTPVPGPAGGLPEEDALLESSAPVEGDEEKELARELAKLGEGEREDLDAPAPEIPSLEAPPKQDTHADEGESYPFPEAPKSIPLDIAGESEPNTPAVPSFLNTPTAFPDATAPFDPSSSPENQLPTPVIPPTHQTSELIPPSHSEATGFASAVFPSAPAVLPPAIPPPHLPRAPGPSAIPFNPAPPRPPPPSAPVPAPAPAPVATQFATPETMDPSAVAKVQKHAKWAISALNYDDFETARKELRAALAMLGG